MSAYCDECFSPKRCTESGVWKCHMRDLVMVAKDYLANNAAESGADALISQLSDKLEHLRSAAGEWAAARTLVCRSVIGSAECHEAIVRLGHAEDRLARIVNNE